MDKFEYCNIQLWINHHMAVDFNELKASLLFHGISRERVDLDVREVFLLSDPTRFHRVGGPNDGQRVCELRLRRGTLSDIVLPSLQELGMEGWKVVEYKSSEATMFLEILLMRKVQKD